MELRWLTENSIQHVIYCRTEKDVSQGGRHSQQTTRAQGPLNYADTRHTSHPRRLGQMHLRDSKSQDSYLTAASSSFSFARSVASLSDSAESLGRSISIITITKHCVEFVWRLYRNTVRCTFSGFRNVIFNSIISILGLRLPTDLLLCTTPTACGKGTAIVTLTVFNRHLMATRSTPPSSLDNSWSRSRQKDLGSILGAYTHPGLPPVGAYSGSN